MNKTLVVPDVHGRTFWREVLNNTDDFIIFLGDYGDPYYDEDITHEQAINEFEDIIEFKRSNPERVVLLIGNHELYYLNSEYACSRFSRQHLKTYNELLVNNIELFQLAYQDEDTLYTHAGVTKGWLEDIYHNEMINNSNISEFLNSLLDLSDLRVLHQISFYRGGFFSNGSVLWADVREHLDVNNNLSINQVFGHTMAYKEIVFNNIKMIDCKKIWVKS